MIRITVLILLFSFLTACGEINSSQNPTNQEDQISACLSIQETLSSKQFVYMDEQFNEVSNSGWYSIEDITEEEPKYVVLQRWSNETAKVITLENSSPSGDWYRIDNYCFNENGTTVKISSDLRTFYGRVQVIRNWLYNKGADDNNYSIEITDMKTQKQIDPSEASYLDNPPHLVGSDEDLFKEIGFDK